MSLSDEAREGLIEIATEMQAAMVEDWRAGRWEPDADRRDACPTGSRQARTPVLQGGGRRVHEP